MQDAALSSAGSLFTWPRLVKMTLQSLAINLICQTGFHRVPGLGLMIPAFTGFRTGRRLEVTGRQGVIVGLVMASWMTLVVTIVGGAVALLFPGTDLHLFWAVVSLMVAHVGLFSAVGAIFGGQSARSARAGAAVSSAGPTHAHSTPG